MAIFRQKPWTNPFGKFRIFSLFQNFIFLVQKTFYSIQNNAKQFLSYFAKKKNNHGTWPFFDKHHGQTPLETELRISSLLTNFIFPMQKTFFSIQNMAKASSLSYFQPKKKVKKGLTHRFGPKMAIFPTCLFQAIQPRKCLLRYSRTKKRLSRL